MIVCKHVHMYQGTTAGTHPSAGRLVVLRQYKQVRSKDSLPADLNLPQTRSCHFLFWFEMRTNMIGDIIMARRSTQEGGDSPNASRTLSVQSKEGFGVMLGSNCLDCLDSERIPWFS